MNIKPVLSFAFAAAVWVPRCAGAQDAPADLQPAAGEIRLDGTIRQIAADGKTLVLDVFSFASPGGKSKLLAAPKLKMVQLTGDAPDGTARFVPGMAVEVVGKDGADALAGRAMQPMPGEAARRDEQEALINGLREQIAQQQKQIGELQRTLQKLQTHDAPVAGRDPNVLSRAEANDLIAALRREFSDTINRMNQQIDKKADK